jgi:type IV secretory pathway VirJ component
LPFLVNRLPPAVRSRVAGVTLLGLSQTAAFEFHVSSWLGAGGDARYTTAPEVARMREPVTCIHGTDEKDSACLALAGPHVKIVPVGGGHHFGGDYARLVELILGPAATP